MSGVIQRCLCVFATGMGAGMGAGSAFADVTVRLDPKATYLRTNSDSGSLTSTAISLASLGVAPGDLVRFERLGGFRARTGGAENESSGMIGVFSSTSQILAANNPVRVPGAIACGGVDVITSPTYFGRVVTDIPQDFLISLVNVQSSTVVTAPAGAAFVFIAANDSLYYDNADADGDFGVRVGLACPADFNGDGFLDFFDYDDYVRCFETGECPPGRTGDFNGDAFVDFFDYDDFVAGFGVGC